LNENASIADLNALVATANACKVAAICVFPDQLQHCPSSQVLKATVINFPTGNQATECVLNDLHMAIVDYHADEIDYVFPYAQYLAGHQAQALDAYREVYGLCQQHQRPCKVILETGALPSAAVVYQLSRELIDVGCDFLKTSTGKIATGATITAVTAILSAIKDSGVWCGIKVSGGIRTFTAAHDFIELAQYTLGLTVDKRWFRIGTSGLSE
jgi:deoxyribose-phosphate aldolase